MRKYLIRFWRGYIAFKDAAKDPESEYVTIRITLNSDLEALSQTGNLFDGGTILIKCDGYEIDESESSKDHDSIVKICYEKNYLTIRPQLKTLFFSLPIPIEE